MFSYVINVITYLFAQTFQNLWFFEYLQPNERNIKMINDKYIWWLVNSLPLIKHSPCIILWSLNQDLGDQGDTFRLESGECPWLGCCQIIPYPAPAYTAQNSQFKYKDLPWLYSISYKVIYNLVSPALCFNLEMDSRHWKYSTFFQTFIDRKKCIEIFPSHQR